jgi:hypothetical protein
MVKTVQMDLTENQVERLERIAQRLGGTLGEAGAALIEEALREEEFPWVDFRDTIIGRQAFAQGSGMAVWEVVMVARDVGMDARKVADLLSVPLPMVEGALRYTEAYPDEIYGALAENDSYDFEKAREGLPGLILFEYHDEEAATKAEEEPIHASSAAR